MIQLLACAARMACAFEPHQRCHWLAKTGIKNECKLIH